jgi:transcription elongation factor Elf1
MGCNFNLDDRKRYEKIVMPIRPDPMRFICPVCGWSKSVAPRSDALRPGEFFLACPKCGCSKLDIQSASTSPSTRIHAWLGAWLGALLR